MKRVTIRPSADRDLDEIFGWIARDDVDAAERQVRRLIAAALALREYPERGRARPEIGEGMRSLVNGRYLIFYRIADDVVEVVRVLHGARDLGEVVARSD